MKEEKKNISKRGKKLKDKDLSSVSGGLVIGTIPTTAGNLINADKSGGGKVGDGSLDLTGSTLDRGIISGGNVELGGNVEFKAASPDGEKNGENATLPIISFDKL